MIVAFEGVDGSGKSTLVKELYDRQDFGGFLKTYKFPLKEEFPEMYNLLNSDKLTRDERIELYRLQFESLTICFEEDGNKGEHSIIDRYYYSTKVYQDMNDIEFNKFTENVFINDLVFIIDIDWDTYKKRRSTVKDDYYEEGLTEEQFNIWRQRYLAIAACPFFVSERIVIIDGTLSINEQLRIVESYMTEQEIKEQQENY